MKIAFRCPECDKPLKAPPHLVGRRTKCPGCGVSITIPEGEPTEAVVAGEPKKRPRVEDPFVDDEPRPKSKSKSRPKPRQSNPDDFDDDFEEEVKPRKKRKKKKKKQTNTLVLALAIGAPVLVLLIGVALWLIFWPPWGGSGPGGRAPRQAQAGLIPADAAAILNVNIGRLWDGPTATELRKENAKALEEPLKELKTKLGMQPGDMDSMTVVVNKLPANPGPRANPMRDAWFIFQANKAYDQDLIKKAFEVKSKGETIAGKTCYAARGGVGGQRPYITFFDSKTLIVGEKAGIKQCLEHAAAPRRSGPLQKALGQMGSKPVFAAFQIPPESMQQFDKMRGNPQLDEALSLVKDLKLATFSLDDVGKNLTAQLALKFGNAQNAGGAKDLINQYLGIARMGINNMPRRGPPEQQLVGKLAGDFLNKLKFQTAGDTLQITASIPMDDYLKAVRGMISKTVGAAGAVAATNKLRQLGLAMHAYHDNHKAMPQQTFGKGLSWRVAILPYINEGRLYRKFKLDEPWNSPHNIKLVNEMPKVFERPERAAAPGTTYWQVVVGDKTIFRSKGSLSFVRIFDGTSNTLLITEGTRAVPWTKPEDIPFQPPRVPRLGAVQGQTLAVFADGSVHSLPEDLPSKTLMHLIQPDDGHRVELP